ncbi:YeeE/YedE family protein [Tunicatimonas pelagia]|uniref:YeeE/YedE family protein n=1 Tax=Tunicatimonas pelagia TaxID=931531 RepID=UPI00345DE45E|nr:YeeE/YedE thiosulfate transporter family protein [Tunicatimonas pelagia]
MRTLLYEPWPWYIAGPLIGLMIPLLLLLANKQFGVSSSLRHVCAACAPMKIPFFQYNWQSERWNLIFVVGILLGGMLASFFMPLTEAVPITEETTAQLKTLGIEEFSGLMPTNLFSWNNLFTAQGFVLMVVGGFLVGFGARYAGGCTSGHAIMGLSNLQWPSLVAVIGFFIGGLTATYFILPWLF